MILPAEWPVEGSFIPAQRGPCCNPGVNSSTGCTAPFDRRVEMNIEQSALLKFRLEHREDIVMSQKDKGAP